MYVLVLSILLLATAGILMYIQYHYPPLTRKESITCLLNHVKRILDSTKQCDIHVNFPGDELYEIELELIQIGKKIDFLIAQKEEEEINQETPI